MKNFTDTLLGLFVLGSNWLRSLFSEGTSALERVPSTIVAVNAWEHSFIFLYSNLTVKVAGRLLAKRKMDFSLPVKTVPYLNKRCQSSY